MLTLSPPKTIVVMVLTLAVGCAPLLAKAHRPKHHRKSKVNKNKIEQPTQAHSTAVQSPKTNVNNPGRGRGKSSILRNARSRWDKTTGRHHRYAERTKHKSIAVTSKKPAHVAAKVLSPHVLRQSPTPPSLQINIAEKPKLNTDIIATKAASLHRRRQKTVSTKQSRPTGQSRFVTKAPSRPALLKPAVKVVKADSNTHKFAARRKQRENLITPTQSDGPKTSFGKSSLLTRPANERQKHHRPANRQSWRIKRGAEHRHHRRGSIFNRPKHRHRKRKSPPVVYHERAHIGKRHHRYEHVYRDYRGWLRHRIVRPRYRFSVYYNAGPHFTFRYFYPYHHRKYIFVSLGGYWPLHYSYVRYYWYPCHPYYWYGYYPIAREVKTDTYNYYTYNYYTTDVATPSASTTAADGIRPVDHTTFADVRERLAQQAAKQPSPKTPADKRFEEAVKAFETADYDIAADRFAKAVELEPDDMVLPFAYAQALFAGEKYAHAAQALRSALTRAPPETDAVFYPRGLYPNDDILFEQIDALADEAYLFSLDGDLQLLLGFQLLGVGQIDEALEPLLQAQLDPVNTDAAEILLDLLQKIKTETAETTNQ